MLLLGIETSTSRSSVALVDQDRVVASASLGMPRRHGEFVAPAISFCLAQAGVDATRVTGVVVGLSGLDVLAFRVRYTRRLICATIDARRGELFWALYRSSPGGVQRIGDLQVGKIDQLTAELEATGEEVLVVGDGTLPHRTELGRLDDAEVAGPDLAWPDAADLAELAAPRFVREETQRPTELQPIYLRQADAKIGWETRGRLQGEG
jgi:tRNA threonylcarbamoyladenosine biosynthesis protein TsaB